ncbi:Uncharacterised protein [Aedoeadaptatus ivorii]|uniref:Transporter associated domain n=1 Tax=Aedoeadaptatus ivorii TaxID=54006 RepID=A0A448UZH8_9FIRM|nr:phosphate-starvation-inducible PsiE family protein [Peptoniphilus ivorii]MDQ0508432.1 hypothetical protein [Peptoniphilus ivorii]VEJ34157.1 Uncharacterised protein [Peptoniphilus ivorii]
MNRKSNVLILNKLLYVLELVMCGVIILGIVMSIPDLFKYMLAIVNSSKDSSYQLFQNFLSHVLLMVIGLEFVAMLIAHEEFQIIYIMVMVVARKMLVYGDTTTDLFIGVAGIAVLFIVRKYFMMHKILSNAGVGIFEASTTLKDVNIHLVEDIPASEGTLGDYVFSLMEENDAVEPGTVVEDELYAYQIETVEEGGMRLIAVEKKK